MEIFMYQMREWAKPGRQYKRCYAYFKDQCPPQRWARVCREAPNCQKVLPFHLSHLSYSNTESAACPVSSVWTLPKIEPSSCSSSSFNSAQSEYTHLFSSDPEPPSISLQPPLLCLSNPYSKKRPTSLQPYGKLHSASTSSLPSSQSLSDSSPSCVICSSGSIQECSILPLPLSSIFWLCLSFIIFRGGG